MPVNPCYWGGKNVVKMSDSSGGFLQPFTGDTPGYRISFYGTALLGGPHIVSQLPLNSQQSFYKPSGGIAIICNNTINIRLCKGDSITKTIFAFAGIMKNKLTNMESFRNSSLMKIGVEKLQSCFAELFSRVEFPKVL